MRFRGTLAARVALLASIAVALSVAGVAAAAYLTVQHQLVSTLDQSLVERAARLARNPEAVRLSDPPASMWMLEIADMRYGVVYADGRLDEPSDNSSVDPSPEEVAVAAGEREYSLRTVTSDGQRWRVAAVGLQPGTAFVLSQSLDATEESLRRLGLILTTFGLLGVVGAGIAGWAVARNGLRPVRRLSEAVAEIARTERLEPIAVQGNDEVSRLAVAFNTMLTALEGSRRRQRQLVADAGHELRTPLTSMRTNLDLLIQADSRGGLSEEARAELMADVRFQIDELTTLIGDLTELARDDHVEARLQPVDLADVVEHAVERVRRRATGIGFDVHVEPHPLTGEPVSLERAVTNLLDNAAKWSPPGGVVTVQLADGTLYVADEGPGIAEEDLPQVFERFYRSPESRTMPGSGLGLSIVRAVAERHGGAAWAGAAPGGGAAFWLRLPAKDYPAFSEGSASPVILDA